MVGCDSLYINSLKRSSRPRKYQSDLGLAADSLKTSSSQSTVMSSISLLLPHPPSLPAAGEQPSHKNNPTLLSGNTPTLNGEGWSVSSTRKCEAFKSSSEERQAISASSTFHDSVEHTEIRNDDWTNESLNNKIKSKSVGKLTGVSSERSEEENSFRKGDKYKISSKRLNQETGENGRSLVRVLTSAQFRVAALAILLLATLLGGYGCGTKLEPGLSLEDYAAPYDTEDFEFVQSWTRWFGQHNLHLLIHGTNNGEVEYSSQDSQRLLAQLESSILKLPQVTKLHDNTTGWINTFRSWLLEMQESYDETTANRLIKAETFQDVPTHSQIGYKLMVQTGGANLLNDNKIKKVRLVAQDGTIKPSAFYNYLTAWANLDPVGYAASNPGFRPEPLVIGVVPYDDNLFIERSNKPLISALHFTIRKVEDAKEAMHLVQRINSISKEFTSLGLPVTPVSLFLDLWTQLEGAALKTAACFGVATLTAPLLIVVFTLGRGAKVASLVVAIGVAAIVQMLGGLGLVGVKLSAPCIAVVVMGLSTISAVASVTLYNVAVVISDPSPQRTAEESKRLNASNQSNTTVPLNMLSLRRRKIVEAYFGHWLIGQTVQWCAATLVTLAVLSESRYPFIYTTLLPTSAVVLFVYALSVFLALPAITHSALMQKCAFKQHNFCRSLSEDADKSLRPNPSSTSSFGGKSEQASLVSQSLMSDAEHRGLGSDNVLTRYPWPRYTHVNQIRSTEGHSNSGLWYLPNSPRAGNSYSSSNNLPTIDRLSLARQAQSIDQSCIPSSLNNNKAFSNSAQTNAIAEMTEHSTIANDISHWPSSRIHYMSRTADIGNCKDFPVQDAGSPLPGTLYASLSRKDRNNERRLQRLYRKHMEFMEGGSSTSGGSTMDLKMPAIHKSNEKKLAVNLADIHSASLTRKGWLPRGSAGEDQHSEQRPMDQVYPAVIPLGSWGMTSPHSMSSSLCRKHKRMKRSTNNDDQVSNDWYPSMTCTDSQIFRSPSEYAESSVREQRTQFNQQHRSEDSCNQDGGTLTESLLSEEEEDAD